MGSSSSSLSVSGSGSEMLGSGRTPRPIPGATPALRKQLMIVVGVTASHANLVFSIAS